ncbi:MAG: hypothetical protein WB475_13415, partial [Pseudolabrys sp.]
RHYNARAKSIVEMADKLGNNKKANWHGQQFEAGYQGTRAAYGLKIERHDEQQSVYAKRHQARGGERC